jgi:hypothetical protein
LQIYVLEARRTHASKNLSSQTSHQIPNECSQKITWSALKD